MHFSFFAVLRLPTVEIPQNSCYHRQFRSFGWNSGRKQMDNLGQKIKFSQVITSGHFALRVYVPKI